MNDYGNEDLMGWCRAGQKTDGLLLWVPDDDLAPLEIWCGTPTGAEVILVNG